MRTKTLLLVAAAAAAGIVSSQAQVYSVNAVGYVNKTIPKGAFALISNPLKAATNTIPALFGTQLPDGSQVYSWNTTSKSYDIASYSSDFGWDVPAALTTKQFDPQTSGGGFFVRNAGTADVTVTFVGEVPQGNLSTALVPGFQIVSSQVPQGGKLNADLKYTPADGDQIYQWNGTSYVISGFSTDFGWDPSEPTLAVGEGFFLSKAAAGTWARSFSVNQ